MASTLILLSPHPVNSQNNSPHSVAVESLLPSIELLLSNAIPATAPSYCSSFSGQSTSYFCEDFTGTSPMHLVGTIPPMSFRDQTFREYTQGEVFTLTDPDASNHNANVVNLHDDLIDGISFSTYAGRTAVAAEKWDITAHSRDGYIQPGSNAGFNDQYWWNEYGFMGEHGKRCGAPPALNNTIDTSRNNERAYTFMERFFAIPNNYNGDERLLNTYWLANNELPLSDAAGIHHIVRYEDMLYVCNDHLMSAAYASGAAKLSLTPNHLLDTSSGNGIVEFAVSTYRTAGRDYWQVDLTPLDTHLQLPEGDVVADANGKAVNGFSINTKLNDGMTGPVDILGGITVFRTIAMKNGLFLDDGDYINPNDLEAQYKRAEINNPGNSDRADVYANAPNSNWVITDSNYNQVMYDYLDGDNNPDISLHSVTDNRKRALFRLTVKKTPTDPVWAAQADQWDQVSLCMPEYGNGCVGEYIVPELPDKLLVQFTHYAYNTTKSCNAGGQQPSHPYQSTCHPNTYHWDNFYISPSQPFSIIKANERTARANSNNNEIIALSFPEPAPLNSKLRFNALSDSITINNQLITSLEVSFDNGLTWFAPNRQYEPDNSFAKFRSYFTGKGNDEYIPAGTQTVLIRGLNAPFRSEFWVRDASLWSFPAN